MSTMHRALYRSAIAGVVASLFVTVGCGIASNEKEPEISQASAELAGTDQLDLIAVRFQTGGDDKRSDSKVWFHAVVNGFDNRYPAGDVGATWSNGTWTDWFYGRLPAGTRNMDISNFQVTWAAGGGGFIQTGDNWNMDGVDIWVWDTTLRGWEQKGMPGGNPLQRFTGSTTSWSLGGWPL
jgi:hypothetical protein